EAIRLAREKGIKVVIATGRPFNGVKPVLEELNINSDDDYVICYNGAKCFNVKTGELVASSTITGKEVKEIFNESQRLGTYFHAFRQNEELIVHKKNEYSDVETRINKITETIMDINTINDDDLFLKAMMVDSDEKLNSAMTIIDEYFYTKFSMVRSARIFLEFLNKKTDKGLALIELAKYLNIDMADTMAIGDAGNDLSMIEKAGIGVCMRNGFEYVKAKADHITDNDNNESGVAEAIRRFALN
ncbi:MAG: HAD family phosphatase, partial [Acholeplasmatales bacterium]|nr:HAD family phosphatase [Acholeplasmatales bacterium]